MPSAVFVLMAGVLWGLLPVPVSILEGLGFGSLQVVAIRCSATSVVMLFFLLLKDPGLLRIRLRDLPVFLGTGVISVVAFNYCNFQCLSILGAPAVPALLLYTAPVFVLLLSALFFGEKITRRKLLALLLTLIGLGMVTGAFSARERLGTAALLLGLGSGLGYALYSIFGKLVVDKYSPLTITAWTFFTAAAAALPLSGVLAECRPLFCARGILAALALSACCSVAPFFLYTTGLRSMDAGRASVLATVEPLVAAGVGALWFRERFTPLRLLGMALVLAAIVLLNLPARRQEINRLT